MAYTESALGVRKGETTMQVRTGSSNSVRLGSHLHASTGSAVACSTCPLHTLPDQKLAWCCVADWHGRRHEGGAEHLEGAAQHQQRAPGLGAQVMPPMVLDHAHATACLSVAGCMHLALTGPPALR